MKTIDRVILYFAVIVALGCAITANIHISQLDDELHRHLALLNAGHYFQHCQIDSLAKGLK